MIYYNILRYTEVYKAIKISFTFTSCNIKVINTLMHQFV